MCALHNNNNNNSSFFLARNVHGQKKQHNQNGLGFIAKKIFQI